MAAGMQAGLGAETQAGRPEQAGRGTGSRQYSAMYSG
jgi:hypothetical protein